MNRPRRRSWPWLLGVAAVAAALAVAWLVWAPLRRGDPEPVADAAARGPADAPTGAEPAPAPPEATTPESASGAPQSRDSELPEGFHDGELGGAWAVVDMDAIRAAMPDNLYWKMAMPTQEPRVLQERDEERARWNDEYGKVLSGQATEEEVRAYYAHRYRLSTDYVEFVNYVLDHYEGELPDQDVGLLHLARRLHLARLQEIPRKIEEALERKRAQDAAREAWLAEEREFQADTHEDETAE